MSIGVQQAMPHGRPVDFDATNSDSYCTPPELLAPILEYHGGRIDLDPCSNGHSEVGATVEWTIVTDALSQPDWAIHPRCEIFVQPPYSNPRPFLVLATDAARRGCRVSALLKHDHTTTWWRDTWPGVLAACLLWDRARFLLGGRRTGTAMFPSTIIALRRRRPGRDLERFRSIFAGGYGDVVVPGK